MADFKAKLDAAVAAGKITSAQETTALARAQTELDSFLNKVPPHPQKPAVKIALATLDDAAKVIGISAADLSTAMKGGKSAAQVANDHGVSTATLISGITAAADSRIDAAVAAGNLDAAHAATLKAKVADAVTKLVNKVSHGKASPK